MHPGYVDAEYSSTCDNCMFYLRLGLLHNFIVYVAAVAAVTAVAKVCQTVCT